VKLSEYKAKYSCRDVARQLGLRIQYRPNGVYDQAACPFHDDKSPSLAIYGSRWKCYGCGAEGDVLDLVAKVNQFSGNDSLLQAAAWLDNGSVRPAEVAYGTSHQEQDYTYIANSMYRVNGDKLPLLATERALSLEVLKAMKVGWTRNMHNYTSTSGKAYTFYSPRWTFPSWYRGRCRGINMRIDQTSMPAVIKTDAMKMNLVQAALREAGQGDFDLSSICYGPKYKRQGIMTIYGENLLDQELPYIVINEGKEIDTLAMWSLGIPCVGVPEKRTLPLTGRFDHIPKVYVVPDNDEMAGQHKMNWIRERVPQAEPLYLPAEYKDFTDMPLAIRKQWAGDNHLDFVTFIMQP
jgi:hypothetical protein